MPRREERYDRKKRVKRGGAKGLSLEFGNGDSRGKSFLPKMEPSRTEGRKKGQRIHNDAEKGEQERDLFKKEKKVIPTGGEVEEKWLSRIRIRERSG